jgi:hypothetical protein
MIVYLHGGKTQSTKSNYNMTYPRDMSTESISMICLTVTAESSISFRASSPLQVTTKPSLTTSKSAQGYRDFKIPRVRLQLMGRLPTHRLEIGSRLGLPKKGCPLQTQGWGK